MFVAFSKQHQGFLLQSVLWMGVNYQYCHQTELQENYQDQGFHHHHQSEQNLSSFQSVLDAAIAREVQTSHHSPLVSANQHNVFQQQTLQQQTIQQPGVIMDPTSFPSRDTLDAVSPNVTNIQQNPRSLHISPTTEILKIEVRACCLIIKCS